MVQFIWPPPPPPPHKKEKKNTKKKNKYIVWESKSTSPLECGHLFPFSYCQFHTAAAGLVCLLVKKDEFVCVEVLQPSQPNGVMSSAVSLPNHTFTGQA